MGLEREVLFVCVENAGRSQMAQAFAEKYGLKSSSGGTTPTTRLNPVVVDAMKEKGIDISKNTPKVITPEMIHRASLVVTMGCTMEDVCPKPMFAQLQKKLVEWNLLDTKGRSIAKVREIRDDIERRVMEIAKEASIPT
ncbi:MAG: low molecular weight phosphatase family protein [Nitrososphaerales archaeon]|jgi:arsenate reductase (thioredoxin)